MVSGALQKGSSVIVQACICSLLFYFSIAEMQAAAAPNSYDAVDPLHPLSDAVPQTLSPDTEPQNTVDSAAADTVAAAAAESACGHSAPLLALPAPDQVHAEGESATQLTLGQSVSLQEELGPLVVNADGTVARISNWKKMTEAERDNVVRVLGKRNKERLEALKQQADPPNE